MKKPNHPYQEWEKLVEKELAEIRKSVVEKNNQDVIPTKRLYTTRDIENLEYLDSMPGLFPFLRGTKATMYTSHPWTIRQYLGFSTAQETNAFYHQCLATGQTGLSVA